MKIETWNSNEEYWKQYLLIPSLGYIYHENGLNVKQRRISLGFLNYQISIVW